MKKTIVIGILFSSILLNAQKIEKNWESIDGRPVPQWFSEAKFGIFIHWGVYSVPAYREPNTNNGDWHGIYAEWYGPDVMYKPWRNDSFHIKNYGKDFEYRDFGSFFRAELWDPEVWANIIKNSGAKYVVLTTKHSDGYCLWPTKDPVSKNWNSGEIGPKRDLVGELTKEIKNKDIRMGFYYSWLEYETAKTTWPHDPKLKDERTGYYVPQEVYNKYHLSDSDYVDHCHFQMKELITTYSPDILWADATWDYPSDYWRSKDILHWMLNNAPNKEELVINDRWGNDPKIHGGYITTEYGTGTDKLEDGKPWEECQGMGWSFGYNRAENLEQYRTSKELIHALIEIVAQGGNYLLNIGPTADGRIPVIMQQRLKDIGEWLNINGEAIYGTTAFSFDGELEFYPALGEKMFVTYKDGTIFLICIEYPERIETNFLGIDKNAKIELLGFRKEVSFNIEGEKAIIIPPIISPNNSQNAYVFKVEK